MLAALSIVFLQAEGMHGIGFSKASTSDSDIDDLIVELRALFMAQKIDQIIRGAEFIIGRSPINTRTGVEAGIYLAYTLLESKMPDDNDRAISLLKEIIRWLSISGSPGVFCRNRLSKALLERKADGDNLLAITLFEEVIRVTSIETREGVFARNRYTEALLERSEAEARSLAIAPLATKKSARGISSSVNRQPRSADQDRNDVENAVYFGTTVGKPLPTIGSSISAISHFTVD